MSESRRVRSRQPGWIARAPLLGLLLALACSSLDPLPPADHVVRAPISERANIVLRNTVKEFGSDDGRWKGSMSPGCSVIWATQFGYRAGVRRDRDDVVEIGRATAERASSQLRALFWRSVLGGEVQSDDPALFGFPALLVSATLGGRGIDDYLFRKGLDRLKQMQGDLRPRDQAGLAVLLAEVSRLQPKRRDERLAQAREHAGKVVDDRELVFLSWAAIARASGNADDIRRAREAEPNDLGPVLSIQLAAIHGYCDLAQATGDPAYREKALALLEHLFSDAYFDGRFLAHDRLGGDRSKEVCSGCNWMALYLVDRLYGDSFVIDPVPVLPERDWPEEEPARPPKRAKIPPGYDHTLVLEEGKGGAPGTAEFSLSPVPPYGRILVKHATHDVNQVLEYELLPADADQPHGWVELRAQASGTEARYRNLYTFPMPLDVHGKTELNAYHGFDPLTLHIAFTRQADGTLHAVVRLRERP